MNGRHVFGIQSKMRCMPENPKIYTVEMRELVRNQDFLLINIDHIDIRQSCHHAVQCAVKKLLTAFCKNSIFAECISKIHKLELGRRMKIALLKRKLNIEQTIATVLNIVHGGKYMFP